MSSDARQRHMPEEKVTMLQAIETFYKGYRFRSRMEARWAVLFDALGIVWEFEKEGYDLDGLWYLPDFWFPELEYWVEVKGTLPENYGTEEDLAGEEIEKAMRLTEQSGNRVFLLCGAIDIAQSPVIIGFSFYPDGEVYGDSAEHFSFARCPVCGLAGIALAGYVRELGCGCFDRLDDVLAKMEHRLSSRFSPELLVEARADSDWAFWVRRLFHARCGDDTPAIQAAFLAAQQAALSMASQEVGANRTGRLASPPSAGCLGGSTWDCSRAFANSQSRPQRLKDCSAIMDWLTGGSRHSLRRSEKKSRACGAT